MRWVRIKVRVKRRSNKTQEGNNEIFTLQKYIFRFAFFSVDAPSSSSKQTKKQVWSMWCGILDKIRPASPQGNTTSVLHKHVNIQNLVYWFWCREWPTVSQVRKCIFVNAEKRSSLRGIYLTIRWLLVSLQINRFFIFFNLPEEETLSSPQQAFISLWFMRQRTLVTT